LIVTFLFLLISGLRFEHVSHGVSSPLPPVTVYHTSPGLNNASEVPCFGVFELTFVQQKDYGGQKNFFDVDIEVTFTAPISGKKTTIGGFYYDTLPDGSSLWKARFAPSEVGVWTYTYTFTHVPTGSQASGNGSFEVVPSTNPEFLRQNPKNPFRWKFDNDSLFVPIGLNDWYDGWW